MQNLTCSGSSLTVRDRCKARSEEAGKLTGAYTRFSSRRLNMLRCFGRKEIAFEIL